jgi:hypothetical protein
MLGCTSKKLSLKSKDKKSELFIKFKEMTLKLGITRI